MKVTFRGDRVLVAQARRTRAQLRLGLSLGRFGENIHAVMLRLTKTAIPGEAKGKRCEITVLIKPSRVKVEHTDSDLAVALERAADKAVRSVGRVLEHERGGKDLRTPFR